MPLTRDRPLPAWLVGSGVIALAMGVMNVGTYGFTIVAARLLGPLHYGALAAVMGVLLVVNVLSLGLQATAARRVAAAPHDTALIEAQILWASNRSAVALGLLCLAASPLISAVLDLDSVWTAPLLAATVVPLTIMGGQAGVLQGERRWVPLALIYLVTGLGRIVFGVLGVWWRPDSLGAMAGVAVGATAPAIVGWLALRHPSRDLRADPEAHHSPRGLFRELGHNSHALLAFFALSNADVIVARSILDGHDAGLYAAGLILTKAVLFLPQFVVVIAFPSMASGGSGRAHRGGLLLVLLLGAVTTAGVAVLPSLAVVFVGGAEYGSLMPLLWGFAVLGTLLALLQLSVYEVVARQHQRAVYLVWTALGGVLAVAAVAESVGGLLVAVASVDAVVTAILVLLLLGPWAADRAGAGEDRLSAQPRAS